MEESVTCQLTTEQSMAAESEEITADKVLFYCSGCVTRVEVVVVEQGGVLPYLLQ